MNVVLIISDTLRRDCLGCYGAPPWARDFKTKIGRVHTPHLDRFAKTAAVFDNAFITSFPTVPTRHDILTGQYTWTFKPWSPLDAGTVTLQDTLNEAGVFTGLVVDTPHPFAPGFNYQRGFQTWELIRGQEGDAWKGDPSDPTLPSRPEKLRNPQHTVKQYLRNMNQRHWEEDYFPARTMREASRWLERNHRRKPFFLYVDTFDPHEPWDPPQYYTDLYDPDYKGEEVIYPSYDRCDYLSRPELRHCRALYSGEVTLVDRWVGHLLERIESLGLMEDTAVIFVSDHGFYLGEHGYMGKSLITPKYQQAIPLYPEVAHIPMLAYLPGTKGGRRIGHYAQTIDLMPTVCDLLGAPVPETVQAGPPFVVCSPTVSHSRMKVPHPTSRSSIYSGDWLLVYGPQVDRVIDKQTTQMVDSLLRQVRTLEKGPIRPRLYNLKRDPDCKRNVLSKHRRVAERLHRDYVSFLEKAGVPEEHLQFFRSL
jgi:arylsulfatase A-like enzyme